MAEGRTRKNFAEHREEMKEGVHYHVAPASEFRTPDGRVHGAEQRILLTERGFLWLAATFRGPLAARVRFDDRNARRDRPSPWRALASSQRTTRAAGATASVIPSVAQDGPLRGGRCGCDGRT